MRISPSAAPHMHTCARRRPSHPPRIASLLPSLLPPLAPSSVSPRRAPPHESARRGQWAPSMGWSAGAGLGRSLSAAARVPPAAGGGLRACARRRARPLKRSGAARACALCRPLPSAREGGSVRLRVAAYVPPVPRRGGLLRMRPAPPAPRQQQQQEEVEEEEAVAAILAEGSVRQCERRCRPL